MALLALPMYALYELSIWIIFPLEKRWRSSSVGSLRSDSA
jgi:Sec-independent protein secretion pathway component TatC